MKTLKYTIVLSIIFLSSCYSYKITNSSSEPALIKIDYSINDSSNYHIPLQLKIFSKEFSKKIITNYNLIQSGSVNLASFKLPSRNSTSISHLIGAVQYQKNSKIDANLLVRIISPSLNEDTVLYVSKGFPVKSKFKGIITNYVAWNKYYHYHYKSANK